MIRLGHSLSLPIETATETILIVGKRGGGKSNTAVAMAEEFYRAKIPFAVLDPVDTWWGLKAGKDGTPAGGLGVYVFGGEHADIPLEHTAGSMMADVLVEHRISAVFVLRQFSNRQKATFVSDFAGQLFKRNREVLHLFCEEAHEVMPQQPFGGEEEMLGRMLKLQKLGRSSGIGLTSITQRPASLNKNATTQAEILVAHRLLGPQDMAAVEGWIKYHNVEDKKREVLSTLPTLKTGEAWLWAPDFPEQQPIGLTRVKIREAHTFDSRKTPKPGERRTDIKALAAVDLERLRAKMASTIEKAKAEDPKQLRAKIAELQRELQKAHIVATPRADVQIKKVPVLKDGQLTRIESINTKARSHIDGLAAIMNDLKSTLAIVTTQLHLVHTAPQQPSAPVIPPRDARAVPRGHGTRVTTHSVGDPGSTAHIIVPQQRILDALAWLESVGVKHARRSQVAFLAGASPTSSAFVNNLGALRTRALIAYPSYGNVGLTDTGHMLAAPMDRPLSPAELHEMIFQKLPTPQSSILKVLIGIYPKDLPREEVAQRAGASPTSSAYVNNLGALRSLGFLDYPSRGSVVAQPVLFLE